MLYSILSKIYSIYVNYAAVHCLKKTINNVKDITAKTGLLVEAATKNEALGLKLHNVHM